MAEIRIERKPRSKAGPVILIVIALLVIAAVWYWQTQVTTLPSTGMGLAPAHSTVALASAMLMGSV